MPAFGMTVPAPTTVAPDDATLRAIVATHSATSGIGKLINVANLSNEPKNWRTREASRIRRWGEC